MNDKVYIIILNWNGWKDTIECLESIRLLNYNNYRIVLIDNGSEDDSLSQIKAWSARHQLLTINYDRDKAQAGGDKEQERSLIDEKSANKMVFIDNKENLGFAGGCNVGLRYALSTGVDYVWLLNNDTVVQKDCLNNLVRFLNDHRDYKGVTPTIKYYDAPEVIWHAGGDFTWYGGLKDYVIIQSTSNQQKTFSDVSFITNCASLYPTDLFREVGLLSEEIFMGEDDFEFSLRLKKLSYKMACNYNALVYHKVGQTRKKVRPIRPIGKLYVGSLIRLIGLRKHWSKNIWLFWVIFYSIKIVYYAVFIREIKLNSCFKVIYLMTINSYKLDKCDKITQFHAINTEKYLN